jgi:hypothetical protein
MSFIIEKAEIIAQILGGLVIVATAVAKLLPKNSQSESVRAVTDMILKVIQYLPTLGVNPKTEHIEKAYKQMLDEKEAERQHRLAKEAADQ